MDRLGPVIRVHQSDHQLALAFGLLLVRDWMANGLCDPDTGEEVLTWRADDRHWSCPLDGSGGRAEDFEEAVRIANAKKRWLLE
jgi:hypothetical protein